MSGRPDGYILRGRLASAPDHARYRQNSHVVLARKALTMGETPCDVRARPCVIEEMTSNPLYMRCESARKGKGAVFQAWESFPSGPLELLNSCTSALFFRLWCLGDLRHVGVLLLSILCSQYTDTLYLLLFVKQLSN